MEISRLTLLRAGAVGASGAILPALGGCAAAPSAAKFLTMMATKLGEAFAMTVGTMAAEEVPAVVAGAFNRLKTAGELHGQGVYGYAQNLADVTGLRAAVAANFLVDGELRSYSTHINSSENVTAPSVVTFGIAQLARVHRLAREKRKPPAQHAAIQVELRAEFSINVWKLIKGDEDLNKFGVYRAITADNRNIEVEWDPTQSRTEQSRLVVKRGKVIKGMPPRWEDAQVVLGIPSHHIWDQA